jgi:hypothetical protein
VSNGVGTSSSVVHIVPPDIVPPSSFPTLSASPLYVFFFPFCLLKSNEVTEVELEGDKGGACHARKRGEEIFLASA